MAGDIALHTRAFVGLELEQFDVASLFGRGGQQPKLAQWIREKEAGSFDVEKVGALFGELGKQVNNVEVIEQAVDQSDHRGKHAGFTGGIGHAGLLGLSIRFELESAVENVAGDIGGTAAGGVGVRAKSHQGLGGVNLQLGNEHAGGLTDLSARERVEFGPRITGRVGGGSLEIPVEKVEQRDAGKFGGGDGAGQIPTVELPRLFAKEVKGADVFTGKDHRHGVHAADSVSEHRGAESGPATVVGIGEVDDQHRLALRNRIKARTFPQGELQLVEGAGGDVTRAEGRGCLPLEDKGDGGGIDVKEGDAGLAQAVGGFRPTLAIDGSAQLLLDCHSYLNA
jgi:hypothetical protein